MSRSPFLLSWVHNTGWPTEHPELVPILYNSSHQICHHSFNCQKSVYSSFPGHVCVPIPTWVPTWVLTHTWVLTSHCTSALHNCIATWACLVQMYFSCYAHADGFPGAYKVDVTLGAQGYSFLIPIVFTTQDTHCGLSPLPGIYTAVCPYGDFIRWSWCFSCVLKIASDHVSRLSEV